MVWQRKLEFDNSLFARSQDYLTLSSIPYKNAVSLFFGGIKMVDIMNISFGMSNYQSFM